LRRATIEFDHHLALVGIHADGRHPQVVLREFAHRNGMTVIDATYHSIPGVWVFEVETDAKELPAFPIFMVARQHR
jgi:hypothetical protein